MSTTHELGSPLEMAVGSAALSLLVVGTATAAYIDLVEPTLTASRVLVYPAVWIAVSLGTAVWIGYTLPDRPRRLLGVAIGGGYTLVLCWLTGLLSIQPGLSSLRVLPTLPGWGPILRYGAGPIQLTLIPFKLVAYLALGYVVYVLAASQTGSLRPAALGMVSCVGCTAPLLLALGGIGGGLQASTLVASAGYDIATLALVGTFGLLAMAVHRQQPPAREG
jgi:hypothetical protein